LRKILYFTGAGLTKSLEVPGKPIPMMIDFISVLSCYLSDNVILTTLATLERNNPYPYRWKSTEAINAAKRLVGKHADRGTANRRAFAAALRNRPSESIEALLERAISHGQTEAADRFIYAISRVFRIVNWNVKWRPLNAFLRRQFKLEAEHTFVNFNYDLLLDRAIQKASNGAWDPKTGYGVSHRVFRGERTKIKRECWSPGHCPRNSASGRTGRGHDYTFETSWLT
jgi:hypothetical protein